MTARRTRSVSYTHLDVYKRQAVNNTFTLTDNQAGHCYAVTDGTGNTADTSRQFSGLATMDTFDSGWDWAMPFIPESSLSNQALVGLGVGRDWTSGTELTQNGSPLWVTPTCQTFFYVDWNNDGTPDKVDFKMCIRDRDSYPVLCSGTG